ncbi:hypothetical protein GALMADRAFT_224101 [Galerina marginata CBS 339.88]|uniref:Uncharacterized protein n=1 Tax=Galerina marginata (strain CBS 339.88) TaxID=685588 RepID=A0A067T6N2_GALM3|nr:hypothetical protein GALMADRAFT_224101 [Galerina marginata CBS 339.88]
MASYTTTPSLNPSQPSTVSGQIPSSSEPHLPFTIPAQAATYNVKSNQNPPTNQSHI